MRFIALPSLWMKSSRINKLLPSMPDRSNKPFLEAVLFIVVLEMQTEIFLSFVALERLGLGCCDAFSVDVFH